MKMLIQKVPMEGIELSEWFIMQDCTKTTKTFKIENKNSKNQSISMETLVSLERKIFNLSKENLATVVELTMELFDMNFPYSYNLLICNLVYFAFYSQRNISDLYLSYLETIQTKEKEINQNITPIINVFCDNIKKINSQESNYLIEKMIEHNLVSANITNDIKSKYFAHFKTEKENIQKYYYDPFSDAFLINYKKLLMNDWELHKKLIKEGVNPNEIVKIIRNDEIEKLQEISSQNNFNFDQAIQPSLYERCSFINQKNVSLVDYAAFFSAVRCFKHLLLNGANVNNTGKYAIAGGNLEIIHLCEQNHSSFEDAYQTAIQFHKNDIFHYIYENKLEQLNDKLGYYCVQSGNYEILFIFRARMHKN